MEHWKLPNLNNREKIDWITNNRAQGPVDNKNSSNIHVIGVPEEEKEYGYEEVFNRIRTENFPIS